MNHYDIYLADLNPTIGREQHGKRPVLIISNIF
ncbi:MAG: Programmed cell death toxin YdcE [uncultured Sulfurovum sp.]|uniref:Programmed cell death toxin YdcE n=1 Tax=uncultured Sulfurovum sp. TaxID=269237 RepID=A0A6S6TQA5_9BACT|nr:MAG: Programmed cell death toxin YdcE [uncultured Sulfurovum sp.]